MGTQSEQLLYVIEINYEIVSSEPNHSAVISVHDLHKGRPALWPCFPTEDLMYLGNPDGICEDISMFAGAEYANAHFTANSSKVGCSGSSLGDTVFSLAPGSSASMFCFPHAIHLLEARAALKKDQEEENCQAFGCRSQSCCNVDFNYHRQTLRHRF